MIYLNENFYTEVRNDKYIIHDKKKTLSPKTQYKLINNQKVPKNKIVVKSEDNLLI